MNTGLLISLVIFGGVVCGEVLSCDSCGRECTAACGTRQFRTCCFNYLRKRGPITSGSIAPEDLTSSNELDPGLRLELWLARSGVALHPRPNNIPEHHRTFHGQTVDVDDYHEDVRPTN